MQPTKETDYSSSLFSAVFHPTLTTRQFDNWQKPAYLDNIATKQAENSASYRFCQLIYRVTQNGCVYMNKLNTLEQLLKNICCKIHVFHQQFCQSFSEYATLCRSVFGNSESTFQVPFLKHTFMRSNCSYFLPSCTFFSKINIFRADIQI